MSLREAVERADDFSNPDIIKFDPEVFGTPTTADPLLEDTITLLHGELQITNPLVIDGAALVDVDGLGTRVPGPGWQNLTIDANNNGRVFDIQLVSGVAEEVTVRELSLTGGNATQGGAINVNLPGAGDRVVLERLNVHDNRASDRGGGIKGLVGSGGGDVEITDNVLEGNTATTSPTAFDPAKGGASR
ncbi:MAG: hypothetical protein AAF266_02110 [Planctomycetota bacterium]